MKRETKCEKAHLMGIVSKYTKEINDIIEKNCEVSLDDIAVEFRKIHPLLSTIPSKWTPEIILCIIFKRKNEFQRF